MTLPIAEITVETPGPFAIHNMPCTVCRNKHAVLDMGTGIMQPCWDCQGYGYLVVKLPRWFLRIALRWVRD